MSAIISSVGHFLPERVIDNAYLGKKYKLEENSIFKKAGIKERRYAAAHITTTHLVCEAVKDCLKNSKYTIQDIDCIIVGTLTPDYFFPSTAVSAINRLGAHKAWGFDISAACSGFCYGLSIASSMVGRNGLNKIIVCGAEKMSATLNDFDYKTGLLFGDGAGAVLIESTDNQDSSFKGSLCKVEADDLNDVYYKTPFNSNDWVTEKFELSGHKVYRNGISLTIETIIEYLNKNNLAISDYDHIIPHQANIRMLREIAKGLNISMTDFLINLEHRGNTGGASIPLCLSEFYQQKKIKKGDRILMCSFGSGYTISIVDIVWKI